MHEWLLACRGADGRLSGVTPISKVTAVARWLGVGTGVAEVPYSRDLYARLAEGTGLVVFRDGAPVASGQLVEITDAWPGGMKVSWVGEAQILADRLVIPDPSRAGDAQTTVPRWSRTGQASTVMTALIAEQLGPSAHPQWRVPGLTVGPDPAAGGTVSAAIRYGSPNLLAELATLAANSGTDLGVSVERVDGGGLLASVLAPTDSTGAARFSADLGNLDSYSFVRKAPTVTDLIAAGKAPDVPKDSNDKDLYDETTTPTADDWKLIHTPQTVASSTDPITTAWGRRIWSFKDVGSSVDETTTLAQAAAQELPAGQATVALTCSLRDTERLRFGRDWGLGHRVTVYVGRPGEPKTEIADVVREVAFEYGPDGERITPAIGSADATALPGLPSRDSLNRITARLAGIERKN